MVSVEYQAVRNNKLNVYSATRIYLESCAVKKINLAEPSVAKSKIPSKGGKVWVKISDKWGGEIVNEGKGMNT